MKKRMALCLVCLLVLTMLSGCEAFKKECALPGCSRNAELFQDYCKTHQKAADTIDGIIDIFK